MRAYQRQVRILTELRHTGAVRVAEVTALAGFAAKSRPEQSAKRAIAAHAAPLTRPGAAIAMSAATTTWVMARLIVTIPGLTVVTNSTTVADTMRCSTR